LKETQSDFCFPPAVADENGDPVIRAIGYYVAVLVNIGVLTHFHHAPRGDVGGVGVDGGVEDGGGGHFTAPSGGGFGWNIHPPCNFLFAMYTCTLVFWAFIRCLECTTEVKEIKKSPRRGWVLL